MSSCEPYIKTAPPGISVLIPAYNEENAVAQEVVAVLEVLRAVVPDMPVEVIVIDDGSTDQTAARATASGPQVRVITHRVNLGYGASLKNGLRRASYETIIITDADSTYPASAIPELLKELDRADMAVGSRTGASVSIPMVRRPAKWLLRVTAQFLAGRHIPDLNSGLRAFRRSDALQFMPLYPSGFSFTTTITLAYLSSDLLVHYVPIDYHPRTGKSKLRPFRDTKALFLTVIRSILYFNPLRVCFPVASAMLLAALYLALFVRDAQGRVLDGTITILVTSALQVIIVGFLADILARWRR